MRNAADLQFEVYSWLSYWTGKIPTEAVDMLRQVLRERITPTDPRWKWGLCTNPGCGGAVQKNVTGPGVNDQWVTWCMKCGGGYTLAEAAKLQPTEWVA